MVNLTPRQQQAFLKSHPRVFMPVTGGWGRQGCTNVRLDRAEKPIVLMALETALRAPEAAARLSRALKRAFGEAVDVTVRDHAALTAVVAADPFPEAATREPYRLLILFAPDRIDTTAIERLSSMAADGERVAAAGGEVAIHYGAGVGRSKLVGRPVEKAVGNWVTGRNWNTVRKLAEMTVP